MVLRELGLRPRKKLSQSFTVDPELIRIIADTCNEWHGPVIEVGAGLGALTKALLDRGIEVLAIEIDRRLATFLKMSMGSEILHVVVGDAREMVLCSRIPVVGNIPYHITSDLLLAIARSRTPKACLTVQLEVANRLIARPGTKEYGRLTVITDYLFRKRILRIFPPSSFYPEPEVYSAVVVMERVRPYDSTARLIEDVGRCLFSFRRRKLRTALARCFGECAVDDHLREKRVYELGVEDIVSIAYTCLGRR